MPRKDKIHFLVRECLENDGWNITDDPYYLKSLSADYEVDLGAEKMIAAEKGITKIAVEVKSFLNPSFAYEFHGVLGQYLNYAALMSLQEPERILYLAVSKSIFRYYFQQPATAFVLDMYNVKLLIFNPLKKNIESWIEK
ncbi:MAG: hypothetical protein RL329_2002 [Bacteroidota bacterium]|jgi:hypothetical protein